MGLKEHNQALFAGALLDATTPVPPGIVAPKGADRQKRFAVYRNNVVAGLVDALRDTFPAVRKLVGDDFFDGMATRYVRSNPPCTPVLLEYGGGFPEFIRGFEPVQDLPYLADVAAIEHAWVRAYHSADKSSLDRRAFFSIESEQAPEIHLVLHRSLEIIRSAYPAFTIWCANSTDEPMREIRVEGGEDTLVFRSGMNVEVRLLTPGCATFLTALNDGKSLRDATLEAINDKPEFDLYAELPALIDGGMAVAFHVPQTCQRSKAQEL